MKRSCPSCEAPTISPLGLFGLRKVNCAGCGARVGPHWLISNVVLHAGLVVFVTALFVTVKFLGWPAGALVLAAWVLFEIAYKSLVPLEVVVPGNENNEDKG
jgi:hypothetical protein